MATYSVAAAKTKCVQVNVAYTASGAYYIAGII